MSFASSVVKWEKHVQPERGKSQQTKRHVDAEADEITLTEILCNMQFWPFHLCSNLTMAT